LFRLIRHWLFNRRDGDGGDEGLIAVQLGEAFGQGAHGGQLVFAELVGPGERAGGGFWIRQGGELGENGVGRMRMKRWWRLLWIVAASVLPAWPGHGVPLCPLPAAPSCSCFGTDLLANGNPIGSGGDSYQYQPLDRLVSRDNGAVLLGYNGDGARVKKTVGGTTTFYLVDDRNPTGYAQVVEEHQSSSGGAATLTAVYTHGLDLIAQRRAGSVRYFSYDGHGSTRLLTDTSGAVTDTYLYDAYGTLLTSTGSTPNDYLYCGEQFDPDLGMYYLRARFYQPQTGRFWTMDSWEGTQTDPLSLHKYLYAADDPVNMVDPSGQSAITMDVLIASSLSMNLRATWERNRAPIYKGAILAAITVAGIYAASAVTEAIQIEEAEMTLAGAGTSVRNEIAKAAQMLRTRVGNIRIPKIVPIPASVIPNVAQNVAVGQLTTPGPLQRAPIVRTVVNRYNATKGRGSAGAGMSWDEYPFASTYQGGSPAVVRPVPAQENWVQGGIIAAAYAIEKINVGDWFTVVITP